MPLARPLRPGVVLEHRDALLAVAARLRQLEPVEIAALAELERLLRADSGSPVYVGGRPAEEMDAAIARILRVLY